MSPSRPDGDEVERNEVEELEATAVVSGSPVALPNSFAPTGRYYEILKAEDLKRRRVPHSLPSNAFGQTCDAGYLSVRGTT